MTGIDDLNGFCYPLTPGGRSSLVGDLPWHYATEYLNVAYRADPEAIAAYLPAPLEPGPDPDRAYVAFSRWWSVWEDGRDLVHVNPERTTYQEAAIWVGCSYRGEPGQICLQIWVSNDFTLARGWFMGFAKRLGQVAFSDLHPLNAAMPALAPGTRLGAWAASHGERLIEASMTVERAIAPVELPAPMGRPLFHIRHFPSIVAGAPPSVLELVRLPAHDVHFGEQAWAGEAELRFLPSPLEEHMPLAPREVLGGYRFSSGYTFRGGELLHRWV
jgi:acetoacetate decarboxylase